jgi:hypothetical protein
MRITFDDLEKVRKTSGVDNKKEALETKITYKDLFQAAESFEEDPEAGSGKWILARKFVDWKNLHIMPTRDVKERVIGFLNLTQKMRRHTLCMQCCLQKSIDYETLLLILNKLRNSNRATATFMLF